MTTLYTKQSDKLRIWSCWADGGKVVIESKEGRVSYPLVLPITRKVKQEKLYEEFWEISGKVV